MIARFTIKRVGAGCVQLAILTAFVFFAIRLLPADPVARFVGLNASPEAYARAQQALGLDATLWDQFLQFLGLGEMPGLLQGSLGTSWVSGERVGAEIAQFLPVTLELIVLAFVLAIAIGLPVGLIGALRPGGKADKATFVFGLFAGSQPEFAWGIIFIFVFFVLLGIAPGPLGRLSPLTEPPTVVTGAILIDSLLAGRGHTFFEALRYLSLPVLTLGFVLCGPIIKMVRDNVSGTLQSSYIRYGAAAGLSPRQTALDALRAAFAPSITLIGVLFGFMLGGAVLVETIFSIGGLGQYSIRSILAFDYPAIQAVVLVIAALTLGVYLLIDIAQALLDPRVTL